jgi:RHS repeat-associated protein
VAGTTSGTISVYLDGALQGTSGVDQSGTVAFTIPPTSLAVGTHAVTASYFMADQTPSGTASQSITVASTSTQPPGYSYSITDSNSKSGYAANGNVATYTDSINGQWTLGYDSLNRLISAATGGQNICWTYDSFGNRTAQTLPSTTPCGSSVSTVQYPNNQDPNLGYDASGNVWNDGTNQYLYDAEGRICAVKFPVIGGGPPAMMHYLYDVEGRRVAKGSITVWSCDTNNNGFIENNGYMIGPSGEQLTEVDGQGNALHSNVFASGHLIATYDPQNIHFNLSDWLGTRRVTTDYIGNIESTYQNLPFGEMIPQNQSLGVTEHFFTGKERDAESGNDYFGARYYGSSMGRFMSPDPWLGSMHLDNPQSLNRYSYVLNNPLKFIDPDGLDCAYLNDAGTDIEKGGLDQNSNSGECRQNGGYWVDGAIAGVSSSGNNITFNVIGADLNRYNATFNTNSPNQPAAMSMDLDSYFGNYALAQRQAVMNQMNGTPTPQQYIQAIALAAPTVCGGGVFGIAGREVSGAVLHGAVGVITQVDSRSGISSGEIVEAGGGEGLVGGGGAVRGTDGVEGFGYEGAGADVGVAGGSAGVVAFSSGGVGVYADGQVAGRMVGGGAYVNITNNATCLGRR